MSEKRLTEPIKFSEDQLVCLKFDPPNRTKVKSSDQEFIGQAGWVVKTTDQAITLQLRALARAHHELMAYPFNFFTTIDPIQLEHRPETFGCLVIFDPPADASLNSPLDRNCINLLGDYYSHPHKLNEMTVMIKKSDGSFQNVTYPPHFFKKVCRTGVANPLNIPMGL